MIFYEEGRNVMIRVNCVRLNMTAADAQDAHWVLGACEPGTL